MDGLIIIAAAMAIEHARTHHKRGATCYQHALGLTPLYSDGGYHETHIMAHSARVNWASPTCRSNCCGAPDGPLTAP